jgi:hypothetical protein
MNRKLFAALSFGLFLLSCNNHSGEERVNKWTLLRADTLNVVHTNDTMAVIESVCRGCAYEQSTHFSVADTSGIVRLERIVTHDNSPSNTDGGSISKDLLLLPVKTGRTTIKVFRFTMDQPNSEDSTKFTLYEIEVKDKH